MATDIVSTRLDKKEIREIERFAKEDDLDKSAFLKKLLHKSLREYKIEHAFKLYKEKKISLGKAAEMAGLSIWKMIDLMKDYSAYIHYDVEDLKQDLDTIKELE